MPLTDVIFILHIQRDIYLIDVKYIDNKFYEAYNTENTSKKRKERKLWKLNAGLFATLSCTLRRRVI